MAKQEENNTDAYIVLSDTDSEPFDYSLVEKAVTKHTSKQTPLSNIDVASKIVSMFTDMYKKYCWNFDPLHLNNLKFWDDNVTVNNVQYSFKYLDIIDLNRMKTFKPPNKNEFEILCKVNKDLSIIDRQCMFEQYKILLSKYTEYIKTHQDNDKPKTNKRKVISSNTTKPNTKIKLDKSLMFPVTAKIKSTNLPPNQSLHNSLDAKVLAKTMPKITFAKNIQPVNDDKQKAVDEVNQKINELQVYKVFFFQNKIFYNFCYLF